MRRGEYKQRLNELLEEDEALIHDSSGKTLYMIDNMAIFGGYELGNRSVDHNILEFDGILWGETPDWEVLVVPETKIYTSDTMVPFFEELDHKRFSKNENHILGGD